MKIITKANAHYFLLLNALFWGSSYIWSKMLLNLLPPFFIMFICSILGLTATVLIFKKQLKGFTAKGIVLCILISLVSVASNTSCMLALTRTSSANTAFIVQLSIVFTPVIMAIMDKKAPKPKAIICALLAIAGVYMITFSGNGIRINTGDILALCNAVCFSLYIALQNKFSREVNPVQFTFFQHAVNLAAFLLLALIFESGAISVSKALKPIFPVLILLNSFVIVFTSLSQSSAIKYVRPESATILYSFEPVTTALLGTLLLKESLAGIPAAAGCVIILSAVIISALKAPRKFKKGMLRKYIYELLLQINTKI
ncbi:threonine/homoserine efflux transporter RhtA [Ruminiclostridium sufflavum DSM 19573]|uniref:Threonine/homoserine efflux transporter RhtA n=1 Tax=Ruminiclostridium sufflavum DSM 19573 TaxID=1121337 RepID=A0A318XME7_9FIRM|nr:DMT family transporter [Ruminiclostridium sufflavum]PYG87814.1 threonine/homoserine efflux transporter RhtA [Ruminiclostridium sufflavum DSM 19573]